MLYILKIKNIFNSKLLFMLTLLLPFTSQAIICFRIKIHTHSYYFWTEDQYQDNVKLKGAILELQKITAQSHNYCAKCERLDQHTYLINYTDRRHCKSCTVNLSPDKTERSEIDWKFHDKLDSIYKILNSYAYTKESLKTSISLYKSNHETAETIDISAIDPDTIPNIIELDAIKCDQGIHPVQSVVYSTNRFETPNTWDHLQQKIHQNPTDTKIEKLIRLEKNQCFAITKPDEKSQSYLYQYTLNEALNREHTAKCVKPIDANHILAFEWDKQHQILICIVLFESKIRFITINVDDEQKIVLSNLQYSETDIPTVKVFAVGETWFFTIDAQKSFLLLQSNSKTLLTLAQGNTSLCPSISYKTDHALYIYCLERVSETCDQIQIKEMIVDSKNFNTRILKRVAMHQEEIECALSLSPFNQLLSCSIKSNLTSKTYLMSINKEVVMENIRYQFAPDFKPHIDWHPTDLMFTQHTTSGRFTLISLNRQKKDIRDCVFLGQRIEYSADLKNLSKLFLVHDPTSEIQTCCYAIDSSDQNDYLFRLK